MSEVKVCKRCHIAQATSLFRFMGHTRDKLTTWCRPCERQYQLGRRAAVKQAFPSLPVQVQQAIQEKTSKRGKTYYQTNRDHVLARTAEWQKQNYELRKIHVHNAITKRRGLVGRLTNNLVFGLLQKQEGRCVYCTALLALDFELDHIIPLSREGPNLDENIQLLCPTCNAQKGVLSHEEFRIKKGGVQNGNA